MDSAEPDCGKAFFERAGLILGDDAMDVLASARVAVFGLGGVGGWCAEALVRTGVGTLMLVDRDCVEASNVNRQVMATSRTIGRPKADVLADRLREINPSVAVEPRVVAYAADTADTFALERFDYVIDAIDSLDDKIALIRHALSIPSLTLFSSMGAAFRLDPLQVRTTPFRRVEGDGLARAMRRRFRETGGIPERDFTCVWSAERRREGASGEGRAFGSLVPVTGTFGFTLASLVATSALSRSR